MEYAYIHFQKLAYFLHFPTIVVWTGIFMIFLINDDVAGLGVKFISRWIISHGFWIRIFRINDDVAGLGVKFICRWMLSHGFWIRIFRINDDVAGLIWWISERSPWLNISSLRSSQRWKEKEGSLFCILSCSTHHPNPTPNTKKSSKSWKSWFKTPIQCPTLNNSWNPIIPKIRDSKPGYRIKPDYPQV